MEWESVGFLHRQRRGAIFSPPFNYTTFPRRRTGLGFSSIFSQRTSRYYDYLVSCCTDSPRKVRSSTRKVCSSSSRVVSSQSIEKKVVQTEIAFVVDVESTGLSKWDEVVEVAALELIKTKKEEKEMKEEDLPLQEKKTRWNNRESNRPGQLINIYKSQFNYIPLLDDDDDDDNNEESYSASSFSSSSFSSSSYPMVLPPPPRSLNFLMDELVSYDFHPTGRIFHSYLCPQCSVHPIAHRLTGLSSSFLNRFAPSPERVLGPLRRLLGSNTLIFHHAAFDIRMLNRAFQTYGLRPILLNIHALGFQNHLEFQNHQLFLSSIPNRWGGVGSHHLGRPLTPPPLQPPLVVSQPLPASPSRHKGSTDIGEPVGYYYCTRHLAYHLFPDLTRRDLSAVCSHLGIQEAPQLRIKHGAITDAYLTARVFIQLVRVLQHRQKHITGYSTQWLPQQSKSKKKKNNNLLPTSVSVCVSLFLFVSII